MYLCLLSGRWRDEDLFDSKKLPWVKIHSHVNAAKCSNTYKLSFPPSKNRHQRRSSRCSRWIHHSVCLSVCRSAYRETFVSCLGKEKTEKEKGSRGWLVGPSCLPCLALPCLALPCRVVSSLLFSSLLSSSLLSSPLLFSCLLFGSVRFGSVYLPCIGRASF